MCIRLVHLCLEKAAELVGPTTDPRLALRPTDVLAHAEQPLDIRAAIEVVQVRDAAVGLGRSRRESEPSLGEAQPTPALRGPLGRALLRC